jgi:hypothetical protein
LNAMEPVEIFGIDTRVAQVVATLIAAFATGAVAVVAARIAHQNVFGLAPIILTTAYGGGAGGDGVFISGRFLVWNRRKHPIEVYVARLTFGRTRLNPWEYIADDTGNWRVAKGGRQAVYHAHIKLDANQKHEFKFELPVQTDGDELPRVEIRYLDPAAGRIIERSNRSDYVMRFRFWLRRRRYLKKEPPWFRWPHKK